MEQGQIHTYQGQGRQKAVLVKRFFSLLVRRPIQLMSGSNSASRALGPFTRKAPVPPGLSGKTRSSGPGPPPESSVAHPQQLPPASWASPVQGFQYTFAINGPVPDGGDGGGVPAVPDPAQLHLIHG